MDYTAETMRKGCVFCGCPNFLEGPSGGMSVNVECAECGARYNFMPPFGADLISQPTKPYELPPNRRSLFQRLFGRRRHRSSAS